MKSIFLIIFLCICTLSTESSRPLPKPVKQRSFACNGYMDVIAEHNVYYTCRRCGGKGEIYKPGTGERPDKFVTCPQCNGAGGFYPTASGILTNYANNFTPGYYLFIASVFIRDDGEHKWIEPGDIGLLVKGGAYFEENYYNGRLFGPVKNGFDEDRSIKWEWLDDCFMQYDYFPVMKLDNYNYQDIHIIATEGDDAGADDVVYSLKLDVSGYRNALSGIHEFYGTCDIPNRCATFGLAIKYCETKDCGNFWQN